MCPSALHPPNSRDVFGVGHLPGSSSSPPAKLASLLADVVRTVILVGMIERTKTYKTGLVVAGAVTAAGFARGFSAHAKADITPNPAA
jgi:hypothetical protein